jgi:putative copper export protein
VVTAAGTFVRSLHLISAAVWLGGLVFLALSVGVARRTLTDADRIRFFRSIGRRFAVVGGLALIVLIATGIDLASARDAWSSLGEGTYGETLFAKLVLVGWVIVLTWVHSVIQGPALSRLRERQAERPDDREVRSQIRRKSAQAGIVSLLNLLATIAIFVLAARLVSG